MLTAKSDFVIPKTTPSKNWMHWIAQLDFRTCHICFTTHGEIYELGKYPLLRPPVHDLCRCKIEKMSSIIAGSATINLKEGADYYLKNNLTLPQYYISIDEAKELGWKNYLGNLHKVAPGKQLSKGEYANMNGHLPNKNGRVWFKADINYVKGFRNSMRILYSNDGLIFVTYDHYQTFYEII